MKKLLFLSFITMISSVLYAQDKPDSLLFSDAVELAQQTLDSLELNATLIGGAVFYHSDYHDDYYDDDEAIHSDSTEIGYFLNGLSLIIGEHEGDSLQPTYKAPMNPTGYSNLWEMYAYASDVDSLLYMEVNSEGVIYSEFYAIEEEELDFAVLKPIPQEYIDSDSAVTIAEMLGGSMFRDEYSDTSGSFSFWDMQLTALHDYEAFPDQNPADLPVMWVASYYGASVDHMGKAMTEEYTIYMDITSGDTLFTERIRVDDEQPYESQAILFSEAVSIAQLALDSLEISASLLGGEAYFGSVKYDDDYSEVEALASGNDPVFAPSFTFIEDSKESVPFILHEHEDDSLNPGYGSLMPAGASDRWDMYAYVASKDSIIVMGVDSEGLLYYDFIGEDSANVEEQVDFSQIKPLPQEYVDSDSAMILADNYGGAMFREMYTGGPEMYAFWDMSLLAIHEYWAIPDQNPADVPVMWVANYYGVSMNSMGEVMAEEYTIYMDISSGDTLFTERTRIVDEQPHEPEPQSIVFSDAVSIAQQALDSMGVSAVIMGGGTFYGPGDDGYGDDGYPSDSTMWSGGSTPSFTGLGSTFSLVGTEHEDDSLGQGPGTGDDRPMVPNGYAPMWEVYAYDATEDSMIAMAVGADGVRYYELFGEGDVEEEVDFSLMKPLPQEYVDSDSAVAIAEILGGDMFREEYSKSPERYAFWDMELRALHEYWAIPDQNPADVPVMWSVSYYGIAADFSGNVTAEKYVIYLDIATGDTVFTERYVEDIGIEPNGIVFSDAVSIAQQALDSMGVSAVIMGGGTFYGPGDDDYGDDGYDDGHDDGYGDDGYPSDSTMWSGGSTPSFTGLSSQFRLVGTEHEDDSLGQGPGPGDDRPMIPNGYAPMWEVYAYDATIDSMIAMAVGMDGVRYYELFGEGDVEEEVDFSLMKPLPQEYVDSDELFKMIFDEVITNSDQIAEMILPEIPEDLSVAMDMELRIIHDYWSIPLGLSPELIPVTWQMNMYVMAMDSMGSIMMEDSLSMYMDVQTGSILYASQDLTNSELELDQPFSTTLHQNYPNPFNPTTNIRFELRSAQHVSLTVYSMLGQQVMTLVNDRLESGVHQITFDASKLASGVYLYRLNTSTQSLTKKMTLIK